MFQGYQMPNCPQCGQPRTLLITNAVGKALALPCATCSQVLWAKALHHFPSTETSTDPGKPDSNHRQLQGQIKIPVQGKLDTPRQGKPTQGSDPHQPELRTL